MTREQDGRVFGSRSAHKMSRLRKISPSSKTVSKYSAIDVMDI